MKRRAISGIMQPLTLIGILTLASSTLCLFAFFPTSEASEFGSEAKCRGVVISDEKWGEIVAYGSYYCEVTILEVLYDPNSTLSIDDNATIAYQESLSLHIGHEVECYGINCINCSTSPKQCYGYLVCKPTPYYVIPWTSTAPKLLLETDKRIYKLEENVTITLTNISNKTIEIGGYPAWQIFTYPEEKQVFPAVFAFLKWSLDLGENDTFTWNQYNEFTQSFVEPGTYVVRDTQGWELSAYCKILGEEFLLKTDKTSYELGETAKIIFINYSNKTAYFPCDPPFWIVGPTGLVYPATTLPFVIEVPSGEGMNWTWDQLNYFTGLPVPPGIYGVHLSVYNETGGLEAELWTHFTIELTLHDIAVINVILSRTVVGQGYPVFVNASLENQGDFTETFNVTAYADLNTTVIGNEITIGTQYVTVADGVSATVTFTWNTSGFAKGNYTVSVYAGPLPGEIDIADNIYVDGIATTAMVGDITGPKGVPDGIVDIFDLVMIARRFGEIIPPIPPPTWPLPPEDINGNGVIDIFDIVTVAVHFGEADP